MTKIIAGRPSDRYSEENESAFRKEVELASLKTQTAIEQLRSFIPNRVIDGTQFGLVDNTPTAASSNAAVLNAIFEDFRIRAETEHKLTVYIPPGRYYIDSPIWAGFDRTNDRDWTLVAHGVELWATDGLSDRIMFDMTGARFNSIHGLTLRTAASAGNEPAIGLQLSRFSSASVGRLYAEYVTIQGRFKTACMLKHVSEVDFFSYCSFVNVSDLSDSRAVILQGDDGVSTLPYPVSSEFVAINIPATTNVDHWFEGCFFSRGGTSDPLATIVDLISTDRCHFTGCFFGNDTAANDFIGIKWRALPGGSGQTLTVRDTQFHVGGWDAHISVEAPQQSLTMLDSGNNVKVGGASIRVAAGVTLTDVRYRENTTNVNGATVIDASAAGAAILEADLTVRNDISVDGDFSGVITAPSSATISLPNSARALITRYDAGQMSVTSDGTATATVAGAGDGSGASQVEFLLQGVRRWLVNATTAGNLQFIRYDATGVSQGSIMILRSDGLIQMPGLPIADPGVSGALWNNGDVVNISP